MMANLVSRTIRKRLDLDINVHLFRHIGTMLYLVAHPGHIGVPQVMLGHTSDKTTQKFYAHLQTTQAITVAGWVTLFTFAATADVPRSRSKESRCP